MLFLNQALRFSDADDAHSASDSDSESESDSSEEKKGEEESDGASSTLSSKLTTCSGALKGCCSSDYYYFS